MKRFVILTALTVGLSACGRSEQVSTGELVPEWTLAQVGASADSRVFGDKIITTTTDGQLIAVNPDTRKIAWRTAVSSGVISINLPLLVAANQLGLTLLNIEGQQVNRFALPPAPAGGSILPRLTSDKLFVRQGYPDFFAYKRSEAETNNTPPVAWKKSFEVIGAFTVDKEDHVYLSTEVRGFEPNNKIYAYDSDGVELWMLDLSKGKPVELGGNYRQVADALYVEGDTLIVLARGGSVQAYDIRTREPKWSRWDNFDTCPLGASSAATQFLVRDETLFVSPEAGTCFMAFDMQTGQKLWTFASPNAVTFDSRPVYVNGVVYANNSRLWALEGRTGKVLGVSSYLERGADRPVNYDAGRNLIYVWGNELRAFKPVR